MKSPSKSSVGINILNIIASGLFVYGVIKGDILFKILGGIGMMYFFYTVFNNEQSIRAGTIIIGIVICFFVKPWYTGFFYSFAIISLPQIFFFLLAIFKTIPEKIIDENSKIAEKNPFLFFGKTIEQTMVRPIISRLYKDANFDSEIIQQFVTSVLQYEIDSDKYLMLQTTKPNYEIFLNEQDDLGGFWPSYSLVEKYSKADPDKKTALKNITSHFLEKCCKIPRYVILTNPELLDKSSILVSEILDYLKVEVNGEWVIAEVFEEDKIEYE